MKSWSFECDGRVYAFRVDTTVIIAHRDDGAWPWTLRGAGMELYTAKTLAQMKRLIAAGGENLLGERIVWATNEADAMALWMTGA